MDINKLSDDVYNSVFQFLGGDFDMEDVEGDKIIKQIELCSRKELFSAYLYWNGIIGFTDQIIEAYENIFKKEEK